MVKLYNKSEVALSKKLTLLSTASLQFDFKQKKLHLPFPV